ncbi:unnamed protein product [Calypogeia fissa]
MGKKKFIDKKKSATFTLVFRDTAAEDGDAAAASVPIRQFTRVDGGDSYVPGFSEDDPRSQLGDGGEYSDHDEDYYDEEEDEEDEELDKEEGVDGDGEEESRFEDAEESDDEGKEKVVQPQQPKKKAFKAAEVGRKVGLRNSGLPENVRRELIELGFPDDGYDYNQHMRSIASTGAGAAFVPSTRAADPLRADVKAYDASKVDVQPVAEVEDTATNEIIELVSSSTRPVRKPLSKDGVLDADIIAALENSEGSQLDSGDELEDEFVVVASVAEEGQSSRLNDCGPTPSGRLQDGVVQKPRPQNSDDREELYDDEGDDDLEDLPGPPHRKRPTRLLDEQFETLALNEYDDFDEADLDDDDPFARGHADISQFSNVLSEFLDDKDIYAERYETIAESHRVQGALESGNIDTGGGKTANTNMVVNVGVEDIVVKKTIELGHRDSDDEEVAVALESEEDRDDWDCETVVSTYSNLDNHPAKIGAPGKSKLRPKLQGIVENAEIIRLSGKQRLPVDYLPKREDEDKQRGKPIRKEAISSGKVAGPRAGETPEEKKARKASLKENRREARLAKKNLKLCYKDEAQRAQHGAATMGPKAFHLP